MSSSGQQRVAIVTGAGSGFGAGIAKRFQKDNVAVIVADIRGDWENVVKVAQDTYGGLNYVINNAGATYKSKPVLTTTEADFDLCIDVNLKSIFHSVHVAVPVLQKTTAAGQPAAVINIASTAGIMGRPGLTWYCGSKAAVISCTKNLSIEFGKQQIRFNAICPVFGNTGLKSAFLGETTEDQMLASIPLGRISQPSDIANATVFLCSDEASFLTGVALPVDGGRLA
ncbi:oxidoreductase, short-chain dehydrogenase/reductase family [Trichosporon asahii var. asahii CBS 8904]|uniref:Oxidoreductase, short-chain dehydrogenase/reductase family n=1 Tax=Trichosporon asahii var. asahii (strain CBS 8904) TaxID=1220162 RepID=K1V5G2_TRIAC|nr:oxidoreductase, short-chain dehydrogenase/reductase family [Trichosporon asahii var. asahii CBS 8904]